MYQLLWARRQEFDVLCSYHIFVQESAGLNGHD